MSDPAETEMVGTVEIPSGVTVDEIRQNVHVDKTRALEVITKASQELSSFQRIEFVPHITGRPDIGAIYNKIKGEQLRGLQAVYRTPFYCRIDTKVTMDGETEPLQLLLTKARETGGVISGEGWKVVSWTSPIANLIEGKAPRERVDFTVRRYTTSYEIHESSKYETLLPQIENAEFLLLNGRVAISAETDLDTMLAAAKTLAELPAKEYTAKPSFGLSDIIVLRDEPQRAVMTLPFAQSVVIQGPPGSGKTSIGIMRIAGLYDRQWEELGLRREHDRPFHEYFTMRVLVYNDEMVEYLKNLAQSIGVEHVQVNTTQDFFRKICQQTKLLTGTDRRDRPSLAAIKGRREALKAYFAGFQAHSVKYWKSNEANFRDALFALGADFLILADRLRDWIERIQKATVIDDRITGSVGLVDVLSATANTIQFEKSPTKSAASPAGELRADDGRHGVDLDSETIKNRMPEARKLVEAAIRGACSRTGITRAMFGLPEYAALKGALVSEGVALRTIEDGDRLWRKQYKGDQPGYSELDLAMSAWLGGRLLLSATAKSKPWIGGQLERLTHIVVDEAQDLSPSHLTILASQLVPDGTMTLVGDIHQNLNPQAGLRRWEDAHLANIKMTAFGINHRQTKQLGEFLCGLHSGLFEEKCLWEPSPKLVGPIPRAGVARSWGELARAIAAEARYWREKIQGTSGATVAVLYDGKLKPQRLDWLKRKLSSAMSDLLIPIEVAMPGAGGEPLRRTDRVVIASVRQIKGLEFDAVVFIESRPRWSKPSNEIDLRVRNGFYVAASRARAGLSICMSNLPHCLEPLIERALCESANWTEEEAIP